MVNFARQKHLTGRDKAYPRWLSAIPCSLWAGFDGSALATVMRVRPLIQTDRRCPNGLFRHHLPYASSRFAALAVGNSDLRDRWIWFDMPNSVEYTDVQPDGSLGARTSARAFPLLRTEHGAILHGNYLYVLGGVALKSGGFESLSNIERARVGASTVLTEWVSIGPMPIGRHLFSVAGIHDEVFVIGGNVVSNPTAFLARVEQGRFDDDSGIITWQQSVPLASTTK